MTTPPDAALEAARERWSDLCREGERAGLAGAALGYYIARRLTSRDLIALAKAHDAPPRTPSDHEEKQ